MLRYRRRLPSGKVIEIVCIDDRHVVAIVPSDDVQCVDGRMPGVQLAKKGEAA